MSIQILKGFKDVVSGVSTMTSGINPFITNMEEKRNKEIAAGLLASGFTAEDILDFIDVDRAQAEEFILVEAEVQKRLTEATKTPIKEQTKAKA